MKNTPSLILASTSPRRRELLSQCGYHFEILAPDVDETKDEDKFRNPFLLVKRLAKKKAEQAFTQFLNMGNPTRNVVILAADTLVVHPNKRNFLSKPRNFSDAQRMIRTLSGRQHQVVTGVSMIAFSRGKMSAVTFDVRTKVYFQKLSPKWIRNYCETQEPYDKAGAYAAQGLGTPLIHKISGSYTNVVGLPMAEVAEALSTYKVFPGWISG